MQTCTHLTVGLVLAQALYPGNLENQAILVGATLAPDVPTALWFGLDKLQGRAPFKNWREKKGFLVAIEITHSLILWLAAMFSWPAAIGVYSHLAVDVASHREDQAPPDASPDPGWLWPLELLWSKARLPGLFDYRHGEEGNLWTPLDIWLSASLFVVFVGLRFW